MSKGIDFGQGMAWMAMSQKEAERLSKETVIRPLAIRVMFAAIGRADGAGHAAYARDELREILGGYHRSTGEIRIASPSQVSNAIKSAKDLGFLDKTSGARCLVLPRTLAQKGNGSSRPCLTHP